MYSTLVQGKLLCCLCCQEYSSEFGDCWPLGSERQLIIMANYQELVELLDTDDDLIGEMKSRGCLRQEHLSQIENVGDLCERNKLLLNILLRSSTCACSLYRFMECLRTTQQHLLPFLTGNTGKQIKNIYRRRPFE